MSDKLKPCPFCGGEAELITSEPSTASNNEGSVHSAVACFCFGCQVMPYPKLWHVNDDEAINAWNTRALTPKQQCADEMYELLVSVQIHGGLGTEAHKSIHQVLSKIQESS